MHPRFALLPTFLCLALWTIQAASGDPPRTDRYGDPLPDGAVFRIGTTRLRRGDFLRNVLISPDRKFVFSSGGEEHAVCMWEISTGREVHRFSVLSDPTYSLSADGSLLAVADLTSSIHLYNTTTGKRLRTIDLHELKIPLIVNPGLVLPQNAFSPDGKILTAFQSEGDPNINRIIRWEAATGKEMGIWQMNSDQPLALSRDARLVASISEDNRTIRLWETATRKKIREWKAASKIQSGSRCLIFSPDSRTIVTAGKDAMIRVYETVTGKEVGAWKGRPRNDNSGDPNQVIVGWLTFTPDGKTLASVDRNLVLRLWDWKTGRELRHFEDVVGPAAFSRDRKIIAAAGADSRIRLWDAANGRDLCPFVDPGGVTDLAFSPDSRILAVNSDSGILRLVEATAGRQLKEILGCSLLAFSPDGSNLLVVRLNRESKFDPYGLTFGPICLLDAATGKECVRFQGTNEDDVFGGWSPDGKILVTLGRRLNLPVRVWDAATGKTLLELRGNRDAKASDPTTWFHASCSPDAQVVALADKNVTVDKKDIKIRLFTTTTGKELRQLTGYGEDVAYDADNGNASESALISLFPAFSPNGKVVVAGCDRNSFGLWDVASGKRTLRWNCTEVLPVRPTFSPDGKWLALPDTHGDPCLVDVVTGRVRQRLTWKGGSLDFLLHVNRAFSPDSRLLAAAYDADTLVLWEVVTGRPIRTWPGHGRGKLAQMAFSPDGRRLATVGRDGTALVWDVMGLGPDGQMPKRKLTFSEAKQAWNDLAEADAAKAYRALWSLVADPERALSLLRGQLRPTSGVDPGRIARLVADLASDDFTVRESATRELRKLGELAERALRAALNGKPSVELRQRVHGLLEELDSAVPPAESLRHLRAVAVLEHIANDEARQLLGVLAAGAAEARLTREARESLARLRSRRIQP